MGTYSYQVTSILCGQTHRQTDRQTHRRRPKQYLLACNGTRLLEQTTGATLWRMFKLIKNLCGNRPFGEITVRRVKIVLTLTDEGWRNQYQCHIYTSGSDVADKWSCLVNSEKLSNSRRQFDYEKHRQIQRLGYRQRHTQTAVWQRCQSSTTKLYQMQQRVDKPMTAKFGVKSPQTLGKGIAVCETSPHRYGKSLTIWDHTVLPVTQQRWLSRLYPSRRWYSI